MQYHRSCPSQSPTSHTLPSSASSAPAVPAVSPSLTAPSTMAVTSSAPAASSPPTGSASSAAASGQPRCCDTGRPIFTDPISGQTVCSCQYELLGYQRLAGAAAAGAVPGLPALSMYSAPYPEGMAAYFPALGADQAPFYTTPVSSIHNFTQF